MARTSSILRQRPARQFILPPSVTLARWRLRQVWRLLLLTGVGMLTAVMLVSMVPLYSQVAMTIGLRNTLTAAPDNTELTVVTLADTLSTSVLTQKTQQITSYMQTHLGSYLASTPPLFSLRYTGDNILSPPPTGDVNNRLVMLGIDTAQAAAHTTVLHGRLPQLQSNQLEVALTQENAQALHLDVGSTLQISISYLTTPHGDVTFSNVTVPVVGIVAPILSDPFWHGETFEPYTDTHYKYTGYPSIVSSMAFLALLTQFAASNQVSSVALFEEPSLRWDYRLAPTHVSIGQLDDLIATLHSAQLEITQNSDVVQQGNPPQLSGPVFSTFGGASILERYRDQTQAAQVPLLLLLLQVLVLAVFFLSMMGQFLIERQAEAIALLRSRGASRQHIYGAMIVQNVGVGLLAGLLGPVLALGVAASVGNASFPPADRDVLQNVLSDPVQALLAVRWYALAAAVGVILAMLVSLRSAASRDVLSLRRDQTRTMRPPLWQRLNLDVIAALVALIGYGFSLYIANTGALDARVNQLIAAPLALVAPICLPIACVLLLPRFFPWLMRQISQKTARRASLSAMLALAQMARAPLQAMRMLLLLALALAFVLFTLALSASQSQQALNLAAHQVGADLSGNLPLNSPCFMSRGLPRQITCHPSLARQTSDYRALPGVTSASLGFTAEAQLVNNAATVPLKVLAVDPTTYAQTALWNPQEGASPLDTLMAELVAHRPQPGQPVPAIVDARAWDSLHLSVGTTFLLSISTTGPEGNTSFGASFTALAEVQHLPNVNDTLGTGSSDYIPPGGLLVDYFTLNTQYHLGSIGFLSPNYAWLRTSDDPATLSKLHQALANGPLRLDPLLDRRALVQRAQQDPLVLNILGILSIGAAATLLLALLGNLVASWLSVRQRVLGFAVLRALGSTPRQLVGVLLWEQGIIYGAALVLGLLLGAFLIATAVPSLVLSSATQQGAPISTGEYYALQHVLPVQVVLSPTMLLALVGLLALSGLALWLMVRAAARPSVGQTLRFAED